MDQVIKEILIIIIYKEKEYLLGMMVRYIVGIGKIIKWMVMVNFCLQMGVNTMAIIKMTKSTVMEYFTGWMEEDFKVNGKMENSKELVNILLIMDQL